MRAKNNVQALGPARVELLSTPRCRKRYTVKLFVRGVFRCRKFSAWKKALRFAYRQAGIQQNNRTSNLSPGNYVYMIGTRID
jgi:hypothetical protein